MRPQLREAYRMHRHPEPLPIRMIGGMALAVASIGVAAVLAAVAELVGWTSTMMLGMGAGALYGAWAGRR